MSDLLVRVVVIDEVLPHPNADKLEIIRLGGWQIVSGKGNYIAGQTAIHVPPDVMVPKELADQWAVTPYLSWKKDATKGRVKCVRLRGAPSFGFLAPNDTNAEVDTNLAEALGIEKYEEPVPIGMQAGQMSRNHPLFHTYTDIQNLRNYPRALNYGDPLIVTEKLHGSNSRVGWVRTPDPENGGMSDYLERVVGSHRTQRKVEDSGVYGLPFELYGEALDNATFDKIIPEIMGDKPPVEVKSVIFFGEIFGPGVQDLTYGTEKAWRVFDIAINGDYLPWTYVREVCTLYGIPIVPHLNPSFYTFEELCEMAEGESVLSPGQIKEGIVVRPLGEETWGRGELDPNPKRRIFKVISPDYLTRKGGTEHH
jgi:RNA ligase (TIGR02306 family)